MTLSQFLEKHFNPESILTVIEAIELKPKTALALLTVGLRHTPAKYSLPLIYASEKYLITEVLEVKHKVLDEYELL